MKKKKKLMAFVTILSLVCGTLTRISAYAEFDPIKSRGNFVLGSGEMSIYAADMDYLQSAVQALYSELPSVIDVNTLAAGAARRNDIKSKGIIDYSNGTVVLDSSDFMYLADEIDSLEFEYKANMVDALNNMDTYFKIDGSVTHSKEEETLSYQYAASLSLDAIYQGILQSQSVDHLTAAPAIADNISEGAAAWVNGQCVIGNGNDVKDAYDQGYNSGYDDGYQEGYEQGDSDGYERGYDEGYSKGKDVGYKEGYEKGKTDGYQEGYKKGDSDGYNRGYDEGYKKGKEDGYQEGYKKGDSDGYNRGYDAGNKQGKTDGYKEGYGKGEEDGYNRGYDEGKDDTIVNMYNSAGYPESLSAGGIAKSSIYVNNNSYLQDSAQYETNVSIEQSRVLYAISFDIQLFSRPVDSSAHGHVECTYTLKTVEGNVIDTRKLKNADLESSSYSSSNETIVIDLLAKSFTTQYDHLVFSMTSYVYGTGGNDSIYEAYAMGSGLTAHYIDI